MKTLERIGSSRGVDVPRPMDASRVEWFSTILKRLMDVGESKIGRLEHRVTAAAVVYFSSDIATRSQREHETVIHGRNGRLFSFCSSTRQVLACSLSLCVIRNGFWLGRILARALLAVPVNELTIALVWPAAQKHGLGFHRSTSGSPLWVTPLRRAIRLRSSLHCTRWKTASPVRRGA